MTFISLIPPIYYNVKQYGAVGDGSHDDTSEIADAINAAAPTGGVVFFPPGVYITSTQTLIPHISYIGSGIGATILKLKNGANTDIFSAQTSSINVAATPHTSGDGTLFAFSIENMLLDGNKANQTGGPSYPLRFYGYAFILRDLEIRNGYSGGVLIDWNGTLGGGMEATMDNLSIHSCNGVGFQLGGPHDSRMSNVTVRTSTSHGFHFGPNADSLLASNIHPYAIGQGVSAVSCLCEAFSSSFVNCQFEGSDTLQFAALATEISITGGEIFGNPGFAGVGLQLGQVAGQTPYAGQVQQSAGLTTAVAATGCNINTKLSSCTNGAINFWNENSNSVYARINQTSGTILVANREPDLSDATLINISGLHGDGTLNTLPQMQMVDFVAIGTKPNPVVQMLIHPNSNAQYGLIIFPFAGSTLPCLVVEDESFNHNFAVFKEGSFQLQLASTFFSGSGAPSNSNGANGDYYFRSGTPGTANQRIYVKSAGSWVGIV